MSVTWNDTAITGPVFIYQDEIIIDDRTNVMATPLNGTLICRSENMAQVGWHFANGGALSPTPDFHFRQRQTGATATPSVSRLSTNRPNQEFVRDLANGLWSCQLNGGVSGAVPVGIFQQGEIISLLTGILICLDTACLCNHLALPT